MNKLSQVAALLLLIFYFSADTQAQYKQGVVIVKGKVVDSLSKKPIKDVTVSAFRVSDTALLNFTFTTDNGNYYMEVTSKDSIMVTYSYFAYYEKTKIIEANEMWYFRSHEIELVEDKRWSTLGAVTLKSSPISMRGDTIEINASRFKVLPGSDVAQLFKKIPGMEVDVKGEVKVNGKVVTKIMVDGSEFFGNNPALVSKTINADMVDKVQIYNEKDAFGNEVPDGETIINLSLKKGKNNGLFGDALFGAGNNERFEAGLRLNSFKNDRKISLIANGNNTNDRGFDFGFESWNGWVSTRRIGQAWGDDGWSNGTYYVPKSGNINNKSSYGFNYFNEIANKRKLSAEIMYSTNAFQSLANSVSSNQISDTVIRENKYDQKSSGYGKNMDFKLGYTDDHDTMYRFEIVADGSLGDNLFREENSNIISINNTVVNNSEQLGFSDQNKSNLRLGGEIYNRLSKKRNKPSLNSKANVSYDNEKTNVFRFNRATTDSFNLWNNRNNNNFQLHGKTELYIPIHQKWSSTVEIEHFTQLNDFIGVATEASNISKSFEQPYVKTIDTLTGIMDNTINSNNASAGITWRPFKQGGITFGSSYANIHLKSNSVFNNKAINLDKTFAALLPNFAIYKYKPRDYYFHFNVNQTLSVPTGSDLLPVYNVFNVWQRSVGNINLDKTITSNVTAYFHKTFQKKFVQSIHSSTNYHQSNDYKVTQTFTNNEGLVVNSPILLSGYKNFTTSEWISVNIAKKFRASLSANLDYKSLPGIFNNQISLSKFNSNDFKGTLYWISTDSFSFSASFSKAYTNNSNSLSDRLNYKQVINSFETNIRGVLPFGMEINVDFDVQDNRAVPGIGKIVPLLHCYIQQPLDKKHVFNLKLTAYDILKQNVGISRTVNEGFVTVSKSNNLQQFFMLTLIYKVKKLGGEVETFVY